MEIQNNFWGELSHSGLLFSAAGSVVGNGLLSHVSYPHKIWLELAGIEPHFRAYCEQLDRPSSAYLGHQHCWSSYCNRHKRRCASRSYSRKEVQKSSKLYQSKDNYAYVWSIISSYGAFYRDAYHNEHCMLVLTSSNGIRPNFPTICSTNE